MIGFACGRGPPGGKQPNVNFELVDNYLYDTEGLRVIGNDRDNNTISMGHVIRGNTVKDKINPPADGPNGSWLGPNASVNTDWRSNHNMLAAIEVGLSEWYTTHLAPQRHAPPRYDNRSCFQDIGKLEKMRATIHYHLRLLSMLALCM